MLITLELPDAFVEHYGMDRFHDSLMRLLGDMKHIDRTGLLSGNYEVELLEALVPAFDKSTATAGGKEVEVHGVPGGITDMASYEVLKPGLSEITDPSDEDA